MKSKLLMSSIVLVLSVVLLRAVGGLVFSACSPGEFSIQDDVEGVMDIPEHVVEDANNLALQLFSNSNDECDRLVESLLQVYSQAEDRDFLLIFNSGGLGREEIGPEWGSILEGIEEELGEMGYTTLLVIYARTSDGFRASITEIRESIYFYPSKAQPLASQIDFLTRHIEGIRVIVAGESGGAVFSNEVMELLEANPRVYSIQTGIPFAYHGLVSERSLVINDNGIIPDVLSRGDILAIFRANLWHLPTYRPEEGHLFFYIRAPGHIYTWDHPGVNSEISSFLRNHFAGE